MTKYGYFFLAVIVSAKVHSNSEVNFVPPQIGKFRNCSYLEQCHIQVDCSSIMNCSHIPEVSYRCEDKWVKLVLGVKTKIPQANCRKTLNEARTECESKRAIEVSQCQEKQMSSTNECLQVARQQEANCTLIQDTEINAALELTKKLEITELYLAGIN